MEETEDQSTAAKKEQEEGKEGKEGKESKEGKEGKEGKESKEGKEGKEGKESKEDKESKERKEGKEVKEGKEAKEYKEGKEGQEVKEVEVKELKEVKEQKEERLSVPNLHELPQRKWNPSSTDASKSSLKRITIDRVAEKREIDILAGIEPRLSRGSIHERIIRVVTRDAHKSTIITCPNCLNVVHTTVTYTNSTRTHVYAILLCPLGLCWCPYVIGYCKKAHHHCPKCSIFLGSCGSHMSCWPSPKSQT